MIEFTFEQEERVTRRDCRAWMELIIGAWYSSRYSYSNEYPAEILVSDLRKIYFFCQERNLVSAEQTALLAFIFLRANILRCTKADFDCIVEYFVSHAEMNNVHYANKWIDFYLAEITVHGL